MSISYDDFSLAWEKLLRSSGGIGKLEKKGKENRLLLVDIQRKLEDNLLLDKYFEKQIKVKLLGLMVDEAIILSEAKLRNIDVDEEEIENRLEVIRQKHGGNEGLIMFLASNNATLEDARREIRNQFLYEMVKESISSELNTTNKEKIKAYFNMKKRTAQITINSQGLFWKDVIDALELSKPGVSSVNVVHVDSSPKSAPVPAKQMVKSVDTKAALVNEKSNLNEITKKIADEVKKQYSTEKALLEKKLLEKELALKIEKEKAEKLKLEASKKNEIENLLIEKQVELARLTEELHKKNEELKKNVRAEALLVEKQLEANRLAEELKNKEETEQLLVERQVETEKLMEELKIKGESEKQLAEQQLETQRLAEELNKKEEAERLLAEKEIEANRLASELKKKEDAEKLLAEKEIEANRLAGELKKKEEAERLLAEKEIEASRLASELKKKEEAEKLLAEKEIEANRLAGELKKKEEAERLLAKKQLELDKLVLELKRKDEQNLNGKLQFEKFAAEKKNYELSRALAIKAKAEEKEREKLGKIVRKQIIDEEKKALANAYIPVNNKEFKINNFDSKKNPVLFSLDKKLEEKRKKTLEKRIAKYAIKNKKDLYLRPGIVPGTPIVSGVEKIGNDKTDDLSELRNKIEENKVSEEVISP